jgi:hypothetical protein
MCVKTLPEFQEWWERTGQYLTKDPARFQSALLLAFRGGQTSMEAKLVKNGIIQQNEDLED